MHFPITRGIVFQKQVAAVKAVDGVSFYGQPRRDTRNRRRIRVRQVDARPVRARLLDPTGGKINFDGHDITNLSRAEMRPLRREMMMVFQDPSPR